MHGNLQLVIDNNYLLAESLVRINESTARIRPLNKRLRFNYSFENKISEDFNSLSDITICFIQLLSRVENLNVGSESIGNISIQGSGSLKELKLDCQGESVIKIIVQKTETVIGEDFNLTYHEGSFGQELAQISVSKNCSLKKASFKFVSNSFTEDEFLKELRLIYNFLMEELLSRLIRHTNRAFAIESEILNASLTADNKTKEIAVLSRLQQLLFEANEINEEYKIIISYGSPCSFSAEVNKDQSGLIKKRIFEQPINFLLIHKDSRQSLSISFHGYRCQIKVAGIILLSASWNGENYQIDSGYNLLPSAKLTLELTRCFRLSLN